MSTIAETLNPRQITTEAIQSVFETMLSLPITPTDQVVAPDTGSLVSGTVGFAGELVTGAVYVYVSEQMAKIITGSMLGMAPEEITGESEMNDVLGEVCNMTAGGLKSSLCDAGLKCSLTVPSIIRGASFKVAAMPDVLVEKLGFISQEHPILVEIHLKKTG